MWTDRTKILIGQEGLNKLSNAHVAVVGIGGVGGYAAYLLARAGVENITLIDFDKVDETNINRQVVADLSTVGKFKTEVMREMICKINPNCKVRVFNQRISEQTIEQFHLKESNMVVDAIDSVQNKVDLICFCKKNNINIVSAMGAGNRIDIPDFKLTDIFKTSHDGLAKIMRKKLRENGISSLDVVTSTSQALKTEEKTIGSISYQPAMCGCVIAGFVINKILK